MPITVVEYNSAWPAEFGRVRGALAGALGGLPVAIEHVGSTAVPGLAAKPVLDIDVVVESLDCLSLVVQRMAAIGYAHEGDLGITGRHAFAAPAGPPARHVYVCAAGAIPLREHLAFRDYLRRNPGDAMVYAALKRELAASVGDDRAAYTEGKTTFVRGILARCGRSLQAAITSKAA